MLKQGLYELFTALRKLNRVIENKLYNQFQVLENRVIRCKSMVRNYLVQYQRDVISLEQVYADILVLKESH